VTVMRNCSLIFLRVYSLLFANTSILCWYTTGKWIRDESLVYLLFRYNECSFYCVIVLNSYDWTSWDLLWGGPMWSVNCAMHRRRMGREGGTLFLTAVVIVSTWIHVVVGWLYMPIWSVSIRGRSSTIKCVCFTLSR
jgi:hypothetical protein